MEYGIWMFKSSYDAKISLRNSRKDFLHKETTKLAKTKSVIVLECEGNDEQ